MTYRESARPAREVVETFDVSTAKGAGWTGFLMAVVVICLVAWGVSVFSGTPRELEGWVWTFPVGAAVFTVPTVWLWMKRKRKMHVVRDGEALKLIVEGEVELTFPLTISGSQFTEHMRGVPIHHVSLKLVSAGDGRGVVLREVRGAIHGPQPSWLTEVDTVTPAIAYDVTKHGQAALMRFQIEQLNRGLDDS
jgi:hypothetical protein